MVVFAQRHRSCCCAVVALCRRCRQPPQTLASGCSSGAPPSGRDRARLLLPRPTSSVGSSAGGDHPAGASRSSISHSQLLTQCSSRDDTGSVRPAAAAASGWGGDARCPAHHLLQLRGLREDPGLVSELVVSLLLVAILFAVCRSTRRGASCSQKPVHAGARELLLRSRCGCKRIKGRAAQQRAESAPSNM